MDHFIHVIGLEEPLAIDGTLENTVREGLMAFPSNRPNAIVWQDSHRKLIIPFDKISALDSRSQAQ